MSRAQRQLHPDTPGIQDRPMSRPRRRVRPLKNNNNESEDSTGLGAMARSGPESKFDPRANLELIGYHHSQIKTNIFRLIMSSAKGEAGAQGWLKDEEGFIGALKFTPEQEQSLTQVGEDNKTIIHQLVEGAKADTAPIRLLLVKYVLRKSPELLSKCDTNDRTPLDACIADGRQVLLDFMLTEPELKSQCISILQKQSAKASCLHKAITQKMEGCAVKMLELLEPDSAAFLFKDVEHNTPLHLSVDPFLWPDWQTSQQAEERVRFIDNLLKKGSQALAVVNKANQTPLQYHLAKVKLMEENPDRIHGPNLELLQVGGVHFKLLYACPDVQEVLDRNEVDFNTFCINCGGSRRKSTTALSSAIEHNLPSIVSQLLDRGANPDYKHCQINGKCVSALCQAAYQGADEIVSLLLDRGANIDNQGTEYYGSALCAAAFQGKRETVTLLLDRGANIDNIGGPYGSALCAAAYAGRSDIVALLLDRGAIIDNICGPYGSALCASVWELELEGHGSNSQTSELLLHRGASVNLNIGGEYGNALCRVSYNGDQERVSFLLRYGANVNAVAGQYGTALSAAAYKGHEDVMIFLLNHGANINLVGATSLFGGVIGTIYASYHDKAYVNQAWALGDQSTAAGPFKLIHSLLTMGADIDLVNGKYGSALGKAAFRGDERFISFLLARRANPFHVGGEYDTTNGETPTVWDSAEAGKTGSGITRLLTDIIGTRESSYRNINRAPFPMPFTGNLAASLAYRCVSSIGNLNACVIDIQARDSANLTSEYADLPCEVFDNALLEKTLVALVGLEAAAAQRSQVWTRNDIRYFKHQGYDLGLAYAAARVAWKSFNDPNFNTAVHRDQWQRKAREIDETRANAIYRDETGHELIKSPYMIMPRRIWDLKSNRVIEFQMLHSDVLAREAMFGGDCDPSLTRPTFWAVTHSWTSNMKPVPTTVNCHQWPVPLPETLDLNDLRAELLGFGAEYIWLDALCLRQQGYVQFTDQHSVDEHTRADEWKLDVPTIGNIYRAAVAIVRYFNGLGQPFRADGWDNPRHWLQRAWTLQEIKDENTTINGGFSGGANARILMNIREVGKGTTLRDVLGSIVKLATTVDSPTGCTFYDLVKQMAKRYATQPTDKVAGLLYLLRITQLPTYDGGITDEDAWTRCFQLLPIGRQIEILFDFPHKAQLETVCLDRWFPTWRQLMEWPDRNPAYDHSPAVLKPTQGSLELVDFYKYNLPYGSLFVSDIWAISGVHVRMLSEANNEYEIGAPGNRVFPFYGPYVCQHRIVGGPGNDLHTLVTTHPDHSHNWAVCKVVEKRHADTRSKPVNVRLKAAPKKVEIEVLKKVGVLRTDSCSEFFLHAGRSDSILHKINALFV